jgi:transcriptional regulator with GAF, ATPase, and Fis domain
VIAATNRDLARGVAEGRFRADLYYRLNVLPIRVPPLRERRADIPALVHYFTARFAREIGRRIETVSQRSLDRLSVYDWPGNVRELQNVLERAVVLATGPVLEVGPELLHLDPDAHPAPPSSAPAPPADADGAAALGSLDQVAREHMQRVLEGCGWQIDGPQGAAEMLGLKPSTLRSRMKKLGLRKPPAVAP